MAISTKRVVDAILPGGLARVEYLPGAPLVSGKNSSTEFLSESLVNLLSSNKCFIS